MKEKEHLLHSGERLDDLQKNGYHIIQHPDKFCFGMDAVLLAHFVRLKKGSRVLDMGTGTGILPILLCTLSEETHFDALEIQAESADMAARSVAWNDLEARIQITQGNIKNASDIYGKQSFDAIVTNPPYMNDKHGIKNPELPKAIARHEIFCTLEDVIREASILLKPQKSFFMIHRPHRLPEIFRTLQQYRLEPKRICLVHPYIHKEPNMVLIEAVRDGRPMLKIEPPIIVYN